MSEMKLIKGGTFLVGTNRNYGFPQDLEGPQISVKINDFKIATTPVTYQEFSDFVGATGYITDSEKFGWSVVFQGLLSEKAKQKFEAIKETPWWYVVDGANWKYPYGPLEEYDTQQMGELPVTQVSRNDALAYCEWAKKRLPSEIEWEIAAKGGTNSELFPWGKEPVINGKYNVNIWEGKFPYENDLTDGFLGPAPVKTFQPNGYGLYQMIGNVWEWCLNPSKILLSRLAKYNSNFFTSKYNKADNLEYAIRGGSFLCHDSYCKRYRISARNGNSADSGSCNLGFRCAESI